MACGYCSMINGRRKAAKLFEDDRVAAFMAPNPATIGHIIAMPRNHVPILEGMTDDDAEYLFLTANKLSIGMFEAIKCEGSNIIIHNGVEAGQEEPHFSVNILARKQGDGFIFEWMPKQLSEQEMSTIEMQLKLELEKQTEEEEAISEEKPETPPTSRSAGGETGDDDSEAKKDALKQREENYLIKQLKRVP